jgi:hypothetical protein
MNQKTIRRRAVIWLLGSGSIALIAVAGMMHQVLFNHLAALFVGVTSCALFLVVWQSKSVGRNASYLIIAAASLCVGMLELLYGAVMRDVPPLAGQPMLVGPRVMGAVALAEAAALFIPPLLLLIARRRRIPTGLRALLTASMALRLLATAITLLAGDPAGAAAAVSRIIGCISVLLLYQGIAGQSLKETDRLLAATATALELRQLSGIIPICMNCKRIQVGEEEWQQLEDYVSAHSRARFSHGICPECAQQVFAEMARDGTG